MKVRESGMPDQAQWDSFFDPAYILEKLGCSGDGGDVVEFGCGYGTFTTAAARRVTQRVIALDIEPQMVAATMQRAADEGLTNVVAQVRDFVAHGSGLPDGSAGYALLFNLLHLENPLDLLREARRTLRPGGHVGMIHWRSDIATPRGPSLAIRPTPQDCRQWGEAAGLEFVREESLPRCRWHWGLVMQRPLASAR
jgi:SAM-dependent methyltransferase